ncbi:MAG: glutamate--tRNA ligase [Tenuifilaceae bacterium]|jgi:glutamyl-tRNA synthetase|nr:glutamate--tRNA ligase [Bacteroidales bacterium]MDI9517217.1 glutamate--tRNA ligase [Bacteroidota bacterium]NLH55658.1 glutamate--tRNA ligase [Rikenellaceae bacterium]OQC63040.1 MAG: Glutamate--tRNA ligase [Bacteroidetes bacterium ADurb.Bin008]HNV82116.1 glutamate--tRNA ligase [Tenuifilaceae bacterium]
MSQSAVRVRFAPSPTGPLHIGGVRTALFNYFFAHRHGGKFILRIEDTDSQRFVPGAEEYINEALQWCGIHIDEGVAQGGPHAPYRQSERKEVYRQYAHRLVESGNAYYAFDTAEELEALRRDAEAKGEAFTYGYAIRNGMQTSLALPANEVKARMESGDQWVIRFMMPENEEVVMHDLIRGEIRVNTSTLDDKVLFKSADMLPTYHLANIVDDYLMEISHVIRGEEWLPSLPLHVLLYKSFGWTDRMPQFAHLPLLLKPGGNGKLSKRDGDKMGFPVFPLEWKSAEGEISRGYREDGYIPEAFVNMLSLLGWNPGTEQEIFSMDELIALFSLDRVNKSGARFDPEKAKWFNHQYLLKKTDGEIAADFDKILKGKGIEAQQAKVERIVGLVKERVNFVHEIWEQASFFFVAPTAYDEGTVKKFWHPETPAIMDEVRSLLQSVQPFVASSIEPAIKGYINEKGHGMGKVMNAIRLSLVGESKGPGVADICELLGQDETAKRIENAIATLA